MRHLILNILVALAFLGNACAAVPQLKAEVLNQGIVFDIGDTEQEDNSMLLAFDVEEDDDE